MSTEEHLCKTCSFSKEVGYRQVICKKTNHWEPELYSCDYWDGKDDSRKEQPSLQKGVDILELF